MIPACCMLIGLAGFSPSVVEAEVIPQEVEPAQRLFDIAEALRKKGALAEALAVHEAFLKQYAEDEGAFASHLATAHKQACEILKELDKPYLALPHARESARLFQGLGRPREVAQAKKDIGLAYSLMGDTGRAREHFQALLPSCAGFDDADVLRAQCLQNIGITYSKEGRATDALGFFQKAMDIYRAGKYEAAELGVASCRFSQGISLGQLGLIEEASASLNDAIALYEENANLLEDARRKAGNAAVSLGWVYYSSGRHREAADCFLAAIEKLECLPNAENELAAALRAYACSAQFLGDIIGAELANKHAEGLQAPRDHSTAASKSSQSLRELRRLTKDGA